MGTTSDGDRGPEIDLHAFRRRLERSDMADELLYPVGHAAWARGRYRVTRGERRLVRTQISGVRFQEADPRREDLAPEQQCQKDVVNLVGNVRRLRDVPGFERVVLGDRALKCRQPKGMAGSRMKFGLRGADGRRFERDRAAARECHKRIVKGIHRSRLVVEHPKERFDPRTGLAGLEAWGNELRLRRRRPVYPWLLLLLLAFLPFLPLSCDDPQDFFGVEIETESLVLLVDKSSSMQQHFQALRTEARDLLKAMIDRGGARYAEVVAYDASARPALGKLEEVDEATSKRLLGFLDQLTAGGGTNLAAGIRRAAEEVAAHGKPTTLVILTDGEDTSIASMLADMANVLGAFKGVQVVGNALTPRLFADSADPQPLTPEERNLDALASRLGGRFGPTRGTS